MTSCPCLAASITPTVPLHDMTPRVRRQPPVEDLVPSDESTSIRVQVALDPLDEPALHLVLVCEALALFQPLDEFALLPALLRCLVPTHVDEFAREEFDDLGKHVLEEGERLFRGAVDVLEDAPRHPDLEGARSAG